MKESVFVDTSALYSVADRDELNHEIATRNWIALLRGGNNLVTTNYVLLETYSLAQRRLGLPAVMALAEKVAPALSVIWITPQDHATALAAVITANRRRLSMVDCSSFAVMRSLRIARAFAFDEHFREQGFETSLA